MAFFDTFHMVPRILSPAKAKLMNRLYACNPRSLLGSFTALISNDAVIVSFEVSLLQFRDMMIYQLWYILMIHFLRVDM